jgi:hypothetical protein
VVPFRPGERRRSGPRARLAAIVLFACFAGLACTLDWERLDPSTYADPDAGCEAAACGAPCASASDCTLPSQPACVEGVCVACAQNTDCTTSGALYCDTKALACVECLTDKNCSGSTPHCDGNHTCVQCLVNLECWPRKCVSGTCK